MLIFGWSESFIRRRGPIAESCPGCQEQGLCAAVAQRYFHIFFLPFAPLEKRFMFDCMRCRLVVQSENAESVMRKAVARLRAEVKTPFYMYAGAPVAALFITLVIVLGSRAGGKHSGPPAPPPMTRVSIERPVVDDLYVFNGSRVFPDDFKDAYTFVLARVAAVDERKGVNLDFSTTAYSELDDIEVVARAGTEEFDGPKLYADQDRLRAWKTGGALGFALRHKPRSD